MSYPGCVSISHSGGGYNNDSIEIPRYDYSTTYSATGMLHCGLAKQAMREAATICPAPCKLTFDLLTLKVVFDRVTCDVG